jgi:hypothetical protein
MSRVKLVMMSLLAVCVLSAVASSTALAAHEFLVNGKAVAKGEKVEVQGNVVAAQLEGVVAKLSIHVTCQEGIAPAAGNVLEEAGQLKIKVELKACTVTTISSGVAENQPKCKLKEFSAEGSGELTEAGIISVKGSPFAVIHIEEVSGAGTCSLVGEFKIEGKQLCAIPDYALTGTLGPVVCDPTGSKELKLGGEPIKLYTSIGLSGTKGQTLSSN